MRHIRIKRADREPKPNGWLIRCARAKAGMSQTKLGVDPHMLSRVENGAQRCGPQLLARLALALGVAVESLTADAERREKLAAQKARWAASGKPELGFWLKSEGL